MKGNGDDVIWKNICISSVTIDGPKGHIKPRPGLEIFLGFRQDNKLDVVLPILKLSREKDHVEYEFPEHVAPTAQLREFSIEITAKEIPGKMTVWIEEPRNRINQQIHISLLRARKFFDIEEEDVSRYDDPSEVPETSLCEIIHH